MTKVVTKNIVEHQFSADIVVRQVSSSPPMVGKHPCVELQVRDSVVRLYADEVQELGKLLQHVYRSRPC